MPSLVGKCLPVTDRLLLRLLPPDASSASVWVEDETDAVEDIGGVRAFDCLLVCAIEVAASLYGTTHRLAVSHPAKQRITLLSRFGNQVD